MIQLFVFFHYGARYLVKLPDHELANGRNSAYFCASQDSSCLIIHYYFHAIFSPIRCSVHVGEYKKEKKCFRMKMSIYEMILDIGACLNLIPKISNDFYPGNGFIYIV